MLLKIKNPMRLYIGKDFDRKEKGRDNGWTIVDNIDEIRYDHVSQGEITMEDFWKYTRCFNDTETQEHKPNDPCPPHVVVVTWRKANGELRNYETFGICTSAFLLNDKGETIERIN